MYQKVLKILMWHLINGSFSKSIRITIILQIQNLYSKTMRMQTSQFSDHSSSERELSPLAQNASVFIQKTYEILNSPKYSQIIRWLPSGQAFIIADIKGFEEVVLPKFFRHNNMNSFIRQLNMYDFHKSRKDQEKAIYSHISFKRGRSDLLVKIQRKPKVVTVIKKSPGNQNLSTKIKLNKADKLDKESRNPIRPIVARVLEKKQNTQSNMPQTCKQEVDYSMMMSRPSIEYLKPSFSKSFIPLSEFSIVSLGQIQVFNDNMDTERHKESEKTLAKKSQVFSFRNSHHSAFSVVEIEEVQCKNDNKQKDDDEVSICVENQIEEDQIHRSANGISFIGTQHFLEQAEQFY